MSVDAEILKVLKALDKKLGKGGDDSSAGRRARESEGKSKKDLEEELDKLKEYRDTLSNIRQTEAVRYAQAKQDVLIREKELAIVEKKLEGKTNLKQEQYDELEAAQKNLEIDEERVKKLDEQTSKIKNQVREMSRLGESAAGVVLPFEKSRFFNVSAMAKLWDVMTAGVAATTAGMISFSVSFLERFVGGIIDAIFQLDEMESSMMKTTGMNRKMARQFSDASDDVSHLWITTEEYGKAAAELYGTMTEFTMLMPETQNQLAATASVLGKWGISAQEAGKSFQFANKIMGQTGAQAGDTALEISALAMDLGVPVKQMMSDFNTMMPALAKLGPTAAKSFKEMARVSKITGLEMQKLLNLTDKFDTFEDAATQTGKLNAALGGNFVNAMDMMTATDPIERFTMLRDALDSAGLTFDEMSYYQRKFFAESMGLESVSDLALMMSGNMGSLSGEVGKTSAEYEAMAQKAAEQATVQEKFNGFLQDIMRTLVDGGTLDSIHKMFDQFTKGRGPLIKLKNNIVDFVEMLKRDVFPVFKKIGEYLPEIIFLIKSLILIKFAQFAYGMAQGLLGIATSAGKGLGRLKGVGKALKGIVSGISGWAKALKAKVAWQKAENAATVTSAGANASDAVSKTNNAAATGLLAKVSALAWPAIKKLGVVMLFAAGAVAIAAFGMSYLVDSFAKLKSAGQILAAGAALIAFAFAIKIMTGAFAAFIPIAAEASGALLAVSVSMLVMGASIALAAWGMSLLVDSFQNMSGGQISAIALSFFTLALGVLALTAALKVLNTSGAVGGLIALGVFFVVIAGAMAYLVNTIGTVVNSLNALFLRLSDSEALSQSAANLKQIVDAINDVSIVKVMLFTRAMKATGDAGSGGGGGGGKSFFGGGGGTQKITISLDAAQTKAFLEGQSVTAQGKQAKAAVGVGG